MCGIAGATWVNPSQRLSQLELHRMTDALAHRGPDGRGVHWEEYENGCGFALGHRRLAIIDAANGHQPMSNASETVHVTFNGEIYNYRELRSTLERLGYGFRTDSDTETIVYAYEAYGETFVEHLRGMFAIGLWDSRLRKLILARDRLGEKPLVFCHDPGRLIFASEIKALQRIPGVGSQLRPAAIDQYLRFGYVPHPWTAYEGIGKLPPGHLGVYQNGSWSVRPYWKPNLVTNDRISFDDACQRFKQSMEEAIRLQMRSDVPMGAFLSGGMDSSVVAGLMQQHATSPIQTFTASFLGDSSQEDQQARQMAKRFGTEHRQLISEIDAVDSLEKLVNCFDEPFADSSAVATYHLCSWTSAHVRVIMTGDGGDELLGGYARYRTVDSLGTFENLPYPLKRVLTGPWVDWIPSFHPEGRLGKLKHRMKVLRQEPNSRYVHWLSLFSRYQRESLYHSDYLKNCDFQETDHFLEGIMSPYSKERPGIRAMRADLHNYLPCDILAKVDMTSMAHGLEGRSPFLDHKLVEAVCEFPYKVLHQAALVKPLLGKTFSSFVSPAMMRRPKIGFGMPTSIWKQPRFLTLVNDLLRNPNCFCANYVRSDVIDTMLREHSSGHINHGERLWSLVFLESWGNRLTDRDRHSDGTLSQLDHSTAATSIPD